MNQKKGWQATLDSLQSEYCKVGREMWFKQWYERNQLNVKWLLQGNLTARDTDRIHLLELGIGWGGASVALAQHDALVVGVDDFCDDTEGQGLPQMRFLSSHNVHVVCADVRRAPVKPGYFHVVILNDVLEHMSVPERLLRSIHELLRPQGLLIMEVPNSVALYKRIRVFFGLSNYYRIENFFRDEEYRGHIREYTRSEVAYMLNKTGFEPIEIHGVNQAYRPWFEGQYGSRPGIRLLLRTYDVVASFRERWKDHFCCLARKIS